MQEPYKIPQVWASSHPRKVSPVIHHIAIRSVDPFFAPGFGVPLAVSESIRTARFHTSLTLAVAYLP